MSDERLETITLGHVTVNGLLEKSEKSQHDLFESQFTTV